MLVRREHWHNINNKVILYLNEYYILYCEFIGRVFEKITNEIDK